MGTDDEAQAAELPAPPPGPAAPGEMAPAVSAPVDETERQRVVHRIQRAVVDDVIPFHQLDDRLEAAYAATSQADLEALTADLPALDPVQAPPEVGHPLPRTNFALLGDVRLGGWADVEGDITATSVIGDISIDLTSARLPAELLINVTSIIGDVTIIVPDGVRAVLEASAIIGEPRTSLVHARVGAPTVRITGFSLIGDVKLYSTSRVPEKLFRRIWNKLRS